MKILLLTPPLTQVNTPYPATAYLTGFLAAQGYAVVQEDFSLDLILQLFSRKGLQKIYNQLMDLDSDPGRQKHVPERSSPMVKNFLDSPERYISTVDVAIRFLQGRDPTIANRIVQRNFLPEGPRFAALDPDLTQDPEELLTSAFGALGMQDRAKYLASLFVDDLADLVAEAVDERFSLSRYGEKLAASMPSFQVLAMALQSKPNLVEQELEWLTDQSMEQHQPTVVAMTAPFPGNVYGAFRIAQRIRQTHPHVHLLLGGGYVNTELRQLSDARVFDYFDFISLDDGEQPFLQILKHLEKPQDVPARFLRTFVRENSTVLLKSDSTLHDIPQSKTGIPTYRGLKLNRYLSLFEMLNPMHRIWSDGRWNKLTLAHGCYWKKCNFCDVSLDYIGRYEPSAVDLTLDRMQALIDETGQSGFHFVDEAAPPALLKTLAQGILNRKMSVTWWGNVRFDKVFTPELTDLLARSGCIAVSGGLEVASDRLLKLMRKGVTVEQVAAVTRAFTESGVMVHAYLMYGFPTQTEQETVDALERVRQLFEAGCLQSAFWHRFAATAHSPIGLNPSAFGIEVLGPVHEGFARNDLEFLDLTGCNHDRLGEGLRIALYNYMQGAGLQMDVREWFGKKGKRFSVGRTTVPADFIQQALA